MLLRPSSPCTVTIAAVRVNGQIVAVNFPEIREKFNDLVKSLGYHWERPLWTRTIREERHGAATDRAAELGHRLLLAGFCVEYTDDALAQKAVAGEYTPEHTRWVSRFTSGNYKDWFCISWSRDEDYYRRAKALHGARYAKPHVAVPRQHYEQVLDFAEAHGFKLTKAAQELAAEARADWEKAIIVQPAPKPQIAPKPEPVSVPGIADELKDDSF